LSAVSCSELLTYRRFPLPPDLPEVDRPLDAPDPDAEPLDDEPVEELLPREAEEPFADDLLVWGEVLPLRDADLPLREPDVLVREAEVLDREDVDAVLPEEALARFFVVVPAPDPAPLGFELLDFLAAPCRPAPPVVADFALVPALFLAGADLRAEPEDLVAPFDAPRLPRNFLAAFRSVSALTSLLKLLFCPSAVVS
jgi:hypothetical protein